MQIDRFDFDADSGRFHYYVQLKPGASPEEEGGDEARARMPVELAVSISENGELADLSFEVPKPFRNENALTFLRKTAEVKYLDPRVFLTVPGLNGDTVIKASGSLELDAAGRIIAVAIA